MRFSANLNIIIKAIEKASNHISRDFVELENLQSNPSFIAKVDDASEKGMGDSLLNMMMNTSEIRKELEAYKNDKEINFAELQKELRNILERAMYDTAAERATTKELENDLK